MKLQIITFVICTLLAGTYAKEVWSRTIYGKEFKFFDDNYRWLDAKLACEKIGFTLAMLSPGEKLIRGDIGNSIEPWIGARYNGKTAKYEWIDGRVIAGFQHVYYFGPCGFYSGWNINVSNCYEGRPFLCTRASGIHHPSFDWFTTNAMYDLISFPSNSSESEIRKNELVIKLSEMTAKFEKLDEINNKLDQLLKMNNSTQ